MKIGSQLWVLIDKHTNKQTKVKTIPPLAEAKISNKLSFLHCALNLATRSNERVGWWAFLDWNYSERTDDRQPPDDIVLIATSPAALQQLTDKVDTVSREYGLEISARKTKVMTTAKDNATVNIVCNGTPLEQVDTFRNLGAIMTDDGNCSKEIMTRLAIARAVIKSLECIWKDRALSQQMKLRIMCTLVWPVGLYGCETWTLKAADRRIE